MIETLPGKSFVPKFRELMNKFREDMESKQDESFEGKKKCLSDVCYLWDLWRYNFEAAPPELPQPFASLQDFREAYDRLELCLQDNGV